MTEGGETSQANNARILIDLNGIRAVNVPEPGAALLLGLGRAGIALGRRRFGKATS